MKNLFDEATAELARARAKHPWDGLTDLEKVAVMSQEAGETLQAACKIKAWEIKHKRPCDDTELWINLRNEHIQTQAMVMRCWEDFGFEATDKPHPYAELRRVLDLAYKQAAEGKGVERHANGKEWTEQPIFKIAEMVGLGYPLGQAAKKSQEARGMATRGAKDAALAEILGAINYLTTVYTMVERGEYTDQNHITVDGVEYEAVTTGICVECAFAKGRNGACKAKPPAYCSPSRRADKRSVIWKATK